MHKNTIKTSFIGNFLRFSGSGSESLYPKNTLSKRTGSGYIVPVPQFEGTDLMLRKTRSILLPRPTVFSAVFLTAYTTEGHEDFKKNYKNLLSSK